LNKSEIPIHKSETLASQVLSSSIAWFVSLE